MPVVRVDFGRDQTLTGMSPPGTQELTFFDELGQPVSPVRAELDAAYLREKGPKTLVRVQMDPDCIILDHNQSLSRYAHVLAVDTNTKTIGGTKVSVTVCCLVRNIVISPPRWDATLVRQDAFEFVEATESPEKIGWCEMLAVFQTANLDGPTAVIVDSHLGELETLNARKQPICGRFFLPDGIELLYASSDAGVVEYVANAAIRHCDIASRSILKQAEEAPNVHWRTPSPGWPYTRYRIWTPPTDNSEIWTIKAA